MNKSFDIVDCAKREKEEHLQLPEIAKQAESTITKVVLIVCVSWIICTCISSCSNRYGAIQKNDYIIDKRNGDLFIPSGGKNYHGRIHEFGKAPEDVR